ncbi:hypothetical protein [Caldivirga sp. UBA161]|uniref:hypothetical protein n=1 Tax=Caldivirga sp. UBA161 TaxID=1915569 RepID=UPI0025BF78CF|nr:hypothetical protein [Caldivirga sp. UBA161]
MVKVSSTLSIGELRRLGEEALSEITRHGQLVVEPVFKTFNKDLANTANRVKVFYMNFIDKYKRGKITFGEGLRNYLTIDGVEDIARYLTLTASILSSLRVVRVTKFYDSIGNITDDMVKFINNPVKDNGVKLAEEFVKNYGDAEFQQVNDAVKNYALSLRAAARRGGLAKELAVIRNYINLENFIRSFMSPYSTAHRNKSVRIMIRWIAHESGVPLALKVMLRGQNKLYIPIGDMYTASTVIRSGAYLVLIDDDRVKALYVNLSKGEVNIPYKAARVIAIKTIRRSSDPIAAEKGAYDIGFNCSNNQCVDCPINGYCSKFTSFTITLD